MEEKIDIQAPLESLCLLAGAGKPHEMRNLLDRGRRKTKLVNMKLHGRTPIMYASMSKEQQAIRCAEILLAVGADLSISDASGATAMHWAAASGCVQTVQMLNDNCVSLINSVTKSGDTPLVWAASANNTEVAVLLMELQSNWFVDTTYGKSAAAKAKEFESWSSYLAVVRMRRRFCPGSQLTAKAKAELLRSEQEARRICELAVKGDARVLKQAVNSENCNLRWRSRTPLMWAAGSENLEGGAECVSLLLRLGADAGMADWLGWTAAHHAAAADNWNAVTHLPHCCVDFKNEEGMTPLMLAVSLQRENAIETLVNHRADVFAQDNDGTSVLAKARECGNKRLAAMLAPLVGKSSESRVN